MFFEDDSIWLNRASLRSFALAIDNRYASGVFRLSHHYMGELMLDEPFLWVASSVDASGETLTSRIAGKASLQCGDTFLLPEGW